MFPLPSPVCCTYSSCWWKSKLKNFLKLSHFRSLAKPPGLASWKPGLGDARPCESHRPPSRKNQFAPGGEAQRRTEIRWRHASSRHGAAVQSTALSQAAAGAGTAQKRGCCLPSPSFPAPSFSGTNNNGTLDLPSTWQSQISHPGRASLITRGSFSVFELRFNVRWPGRGRSSWSG